MTGERDTKQDSTIIVHVDADLQELIPGYLATRQADIKAMREADVSRGERQ